MGNYRVIHGHRTLTLQAESDHTPGLEVSFQQSGNPQPIAAQEFSVINLQQATKALTNLGCELLEEGNSKSTFRDPELNLLTVTPFEPV